MKIIRKDGKSHCIISRNNTLRVYTNYQYIIDQMSEHPILYTNATRYREIGPNTIIMGDFNTLLSPIDRSSTQNSIKKSELNYNIDQLDLIDIYRVLHKTAAEHTFF